MNAKVPDAGEQGLPLKMTVQSRVTKHVFAVIEVFVIVVDKGAQPIAGEMVKLGTGGTSIQTVLVMVEVPQPFDTVNETI